MSRAIKRAGLATCLIMIGSFGAHHAKAVGDTRTLSMHHMHTDESITITYKKNGEYDEEALKKINWFLRDWRKSESVTMDPSEIDLLWEVYQEVGAKEPIEIVCGYRSSGTNEMLRSRSKNSGVARHSQHTLGKAIDFYIPGIPLEKLRETAMKVQGGGVGYYPTSGSPFVHVDVGNVRAWPRMTREQLVKLFPDGRTVHLPSNGGPLPGYELAKADLERGHRSVGEPQKRSLFARLFGRDKDAEEAADNAAARDSVTTGRAATAKTEVAKADTNKTEPSKLIPARVQLASAAEPPAPAPIPMPPRRPVFQLAAATQSKPAPAAAAPAQPQPVQVASLSPNAIVSMRGMWDDSTPAAAPSGKLAVAETNALSVPVTRGLSTARETAAGRETTASIGPFPTDRVPPDTALAYAAAQAESRRAAVTSKGTTSTASKAADAIATSRITPAADRLDDPWTRGVVLAQSLQSSLVVTQVGDTDFASFTQFMRKPTSAVMMSFASEPYAGISADQFSGAAVVFPTTVTFGTPRRTASLQ